MILAIEPRKPYFPFRQNLNGERALLAAVLAQACKDAFSQSAKATAARDDALHFFCSSDYQRHLAALDLPSDWLPDGIKRLD